MVVHFIVSADPISSYSLDFFAEMDDFIRNPGEKTAQQERGFLPKMANWDECLDPDYNEPNSTELYVPQITFDNLTVQLIDTTPPEANIQGNRNEFKMIGQLQSEVSDDYHLDLDNKQTDGTTSSTIKYWTESIDSQEKRFDLDMPSPDQSLVIPFDEDDFSLHTSFTEPQTNQQLPSSQNGECLQLDQRTSTPPISSHPILPIVDAPPSLSYIHSLHDLYKNCLHNSQNSNIGIEERNQMLEFSKNLKIDIEILEAKYEKHLENSREKQMEHTPIDCLLEGVGPGDPIAHPFSLVDCSLSDAKTEQNYAAPTYTDLHPIDNQPLSSGPQDVLSDHHTIQRPTSRKRTNQQMCTQQKNHTNPSEIPPSMDNAVHTSDQLQTRTSSSPTTGTKAFEEALAEWENWEHKNEAYETIDLTVYLFNPNGAKTVPQIVRLTQNVFNFYRTCYAQNNSGSLRNMKEAYFEMTSSGLKSGWEEIRKQVEEWQNYQISKGWIRTVRREELAEIE